MNPTVAGALYVGAVKTETASGQIVSTGVAGLDEVLYGGLLEGQFYLVEGEPGTRKTALSCNFFWKEPGAASRFVYLFVGVGKKDPTGCSLPWLVARGGYYLSIHSCRAEPESRGTVFGISSP